MILLVLGACDPEAVVHAMLHVLTHFGGRICSGALVLILREAGASQREFVEAWIRATDASLVVEIGDTTYLARAGRELLARSAPDLAALARRSA